MHTERFAVDAVLFDLDGTLVDSDHALERSWTSWALEHEISGARLEAEAVAGRTSAEVVAALLPPVAVPTAVDRIEQLEVEILDGVRAYPGAARLLSETPTGHWAIVTSGTERVARARLAATHLPHPPALVTADDVTAGKPDPEPYRYGAERLGVRADRCLAVEDAPVGLASARAAGMRVVGVRTTTSVEQLSTADVVVDGLEDLTVTDGGNRSDLLVTVRKSSCSS